MKEFCALEEIRRPGGWWAKVSEHTKINSLFSVPAKNLASTPSPSTSNVTFIQLQPSSLERDSKSA